MVNLSVVDMFTERCSMCRVCCVETCNCVMMCIDVKAVPPRAYNTAC